MKRTLAILLCAVLLLACLPMSVFATIIITRVDLIMDLPVAGQTPKQNCSILGNGYTIHSIDWEEIGGRGFLEAGEKFQEGYTYKATLWVKASDGYEFSYGDSYTPAITGYINGESVTVTKAYEYNAWAMVCLTYQFDNIPAKGWIKNINLSVPAPAAGEKPSYTQLTGVGYGTANVSFGDSTNSNMKNGIAWYPVGGDYLKPGQDTFGENTSYTFHCLIFPAEGYKISEKAAVWVNGKEAEATLDYDTFLSVTYTFPATGRIPPTHTHSYTNWAWNSGQHYKNCTGCDEIFFAEAHKGGVATCEKDGVCSVCGFAYILAGEEYHTPDTSKWVARVDMYHYHKCSICGAHCDIEDHKWSPTYLYQDKTGHAWVCADCKTHSAIEEHVPGPAGTPGAAVVCRDCGYIITPEENHQHKLTPVVEKAATCTEDGNVAYYTCEGCNDLFADKDGKTKLEDVIVPALEHDMQNGQCARCGYGLGETAPTEPAATEEPTAPVVAEPGESDVPDVVQTPNRGLLWVFVGLAAAAVALAVVIVIVSKRKKAQ